MKVLTILATSGALALAAVAAPTTADARCRGCGVGIAAGVVGGIAAGAAIAAASSPRYYGPAYDSGYGYGNAPGYAYESYPAPAYGGYYGGYRYGGSTADYTNMDRQLQGTR
jgi:hypothetical protein